MKKTIIQIQRLNCNHSKNLGHFYETKKPKTAHQTGRAT